MKSLFVFIICMFGFLGCQGHDDTTDAANLMEQKGDIAYSRREYSSALDIWNKQIKKNEQNARLLIKISDAYFKIGRPQRSKYYLLKAFEIEPENIKAIIKLSKIFFYLGEFDLLDKLLSESEQNGFNDPDLNLLKADLNLIKNKPKTAEHYYRAAVISSKDSMRMMIKLAIFLKTQKRDNEADELIKIVNNSNVTSIPVLLLLSDYYFLNNQVEKAEQYIQSAIKLEPEDNSLKLQLVQHYISTGKTIKAENILIKMVQTQKDDFLEMMLADVFIENRKFDQADNIIKKIKEKIKEPVIQFELLQGKYWLYSGKNIFATSYLKTALDLRPDLVNTHYLLAFTHLVNGKKKLSENSLKNALYLNPQHYDALLLISLLLYKSNDYDLSLEYLNRLLKYYPEDVIARIVQGLNYLELKNFEDARNSFEQALKLSDESFIPLYYLGLTNEFNMHLEKAVEYYAAVLKEKPKMLDVADRYCMLLMKTGQEKTAVQFIQEKLKQEPENCAYYYIAAKLAFTLKEFEKGEAYLKQMIQFEDASGPMYMTLAMHYKEKNNLDKSILTLKECTQKRPAYQEGWLELSRLYTDSKDLITAIEIMEQGYKLFPDSPVFQSNLAWLLLENESQISRALSLAQKAFEQQPDNVAFADTLGWAYYHKGVYSQANWLLSDALKNSPNNGFILYHLGMTHTKQGEFEKAKAYLSKAKNTGDYICFFDRLDTALDELSARKKRPSVSSELSAEPELLLPPKIKAVDEDMLAPQWNQ